MFENERVAIITGGDSSERNVGLLTAENVSASFDRMGIAHETFDIPDYQGLLNLPLESFSRVFLALHGGFGENGMAQSYLCGRNIPHNGPSPQASAICMDKLLTKHVARGLGIRVPEYIFYENESSVSFDEISDLFGSRFIVKPNGEGCSKGVTLVQGNLGSFDVAVKSASSYGCGILIEEFISGQELSVCYFYNQMLPTFAVGYTTEFFSYEAKYESDHTQAWLLKTDEKIMAAVDRDGSVFAKALHLPYYRADVIISDGAPYLIEFNSLPGLSAHSFFPRACAEIGIGFDEMVLYLNNLKKRPS
jgi:D-alanine-D-alanine ligase